MELIKQERTRAMKETKIKELDFNEKMFSTPEGLFELGMSVRQNGYCYKDYKDGHGIFFMDYGKVRFAFFDVGSDTYSLSVTIPIGMGLSKPVSAFVFTEKRILKIFSAEEMKKYFRSSE